MAIKSDFFGIIGAKSVADCARSTIYHSKSTNCRTKSSAIGAFSAIRQAKRAVVRARSAGHRAKCANAEAKKVAIVIKSAEDRALGSNGRAVGQGFIQPRRAYFVPGVERRMGAFCGGGSKLVRASRTRLSIQKPTAPM